MKHTLQPVVTILIGLIVISALVLSIYVIGFGTMLLIGPALLDTSDISIHEIRMWNGVITLLVLGVAYVTGLIIQQEY